MLSVPDFKRVKIRYRTNKRLSNLQKAIYKIVADVIKFKLNGSVLHLPLHFALHAMQDKQ